MKVVLDAGPLIHFSWIDSLDLLRQLFEEIVLPPAVRDEVLAPPSGTLGLDRIQRALAAGWLHAEAPAALASPDIPPGLGAGETEALLLAEQIGADLMITDDSAARSLARRRGLDVMGTIGVLIEARERGLIPEALPYLLELRRLGQWIGEELVEAVRQQELGTSR